MPLLIGSGPKISVQLVKGKVVIWSIKKCNNYAYLKLFCHFIPWTLILGIGFIFVAFSNNAE